MWLEIRGIFEADRYKEHRVEKKNLSWSSSSTAIPRFQKGRIWYAGNLRIAGACNQTIMGSAATKDGKNVVQTCRALTIQHYVENQFHIMHFRIVQLFSGSISFRYVDGHLVTTLWTFLFFFLSFHLAGPQCGWSALQHGGHNCHIANRFRIHYSPTDWKCWPSHIDQLLYFLIIKKKEEINQHINGTDLLARTLFDRLDCFIWTSLVLYDYFLSLQDTASFRCTAKWRERERISKLMQWNRTTFFYRRIYSIINPPPRYVNALLKR